MRARTRPRGWSCRSDAWAISFFRTPSDSRKPPPRRPNSNTVAAVRKGLSARCAGEHPEEALDIRVGTHGAVAVEVLAAAPRAAVARQAGEVGLDVRVGSDSSVAVEVGGAREAQDNSDHVSPGGG